MSPAKLLAFSVALSLVLAASSGAATLLSESVTGGHLDLTWVSGFSTPNTMYGKTLDTSMPGYANPSGDHTVAVAQNASPDSGGIIVTSTDPGAIDADYVWEANIFTGGGESRRGLTLRADPSNDFMSFYMLVIEPGLFQIRFRKLVNGAPTTLASWFSTVLPAQSIPQNTWHKLKVVAQGSTFRCFFDDFELTTAPIVDSEIASGWVGVYNFRFDLGNVPVYFDDMKLSCVTSTAAGFRLEPRALNLSSCGRWVEAEITPPAPLTVNDIDVRSIRLNGKVPVDSLAPVVAAGDGLSLRVKFRRADVLLALTPGDAVTVSVTGLMAGGCFEGTDVVSVHPPQVHHPQAGDHIAAGSSLAIDWESNGSSSPTVAILSSVNDGLTWGLVANGIANTGRYDWVVPNWPTASARLAVVEIDSYDPTDPTGYTVSGSVGVSDAFSITGVLGVEDPGVGFALRALGNPSTGSLRVSYALPDTKPGSLEVFDVTGRQVSTRAIGGEGPGMHTVQLAAWVPPGVYVVRLAQGGRSLSARITVVR